MPTLAQRVWPRTEAAACSEASARWSSSSSRMAARSARVLSPSSPISAAALYTKLRCPPGVRTAMDRNSGSWARGASRAATPASARSRPWSRTSTVSPAESRPRTSSRSRAERACWIEVPTSMADHDGSGPTRSATARAVPSRSRSMAHAASFSRISAALATSSSAGLAAPSASRAASSPAMALPSSPARPSTLAARARSRRRVATPVGPRRAASTPSSRSAAASAEPATSPGASSRPRASRRGSTTSAAARVRRAPGPRSTAMIPHTGSSSTGDGTGRSYCPLPGAGVRPAARRRRRPGPARRRWLTTSSAPATSRRGRMGPAAAGLRRSQSPGRPDRDPTRGAEAMPGARSRAGPIASGPIA
jgi:hypothetical protein